MEDFFSPDFSHQLSDRLLAARTVVVSGRLDQHAAARVTAQLTALAQTPDRISLYLSAYGDDFEAGQALYDLVRFVGPRVRVVATGTVAGAAVIVYAAPPRQERFCLPNARFTLKRPERRAAPTRDLEAEAEEIRRLREQFTRLLADATGQPLTRIEEDTRRPISLSAADAVDYGLAGRLVQHVNEIS